MKQLSCSLIILTAFLSLACNRHSADLAGLWEIRLDPENKGLSEHWSTSRFDQFITLPGTTDEAGYGIKTSDTAYGILSREFAYIGPVWYNREIDIPQSWENKHLVIFLERVLWESRAFVDGVEKSSQDALGTPHLHEIGPLAPGRHLLSIRVNNDMIHNIGDKGHAYGEYMQSIWNGMVGKLEIRAYPDIRMEQLKTYPDPEKDQVEVEMVFSENLPKTPIKFVLREKNSQKVVASASVEATGAKFRHTLKANQSVTPWSEYQPFLYELEVILDPRGANHISKTTLGFATVEKSEHHILINGEPVFLRGNLDCVHFPLTGYPSTNKQDWSAILSRYKEYGLNHVRFHSWCPPKAAFEAADELGIYIQAEASVWIDWWMGTDMVSRGRPEMETKGHPQGIGMGDENADDFIRQEMDRVIDTYGNHPSFVLFCIGNELGSSNFNVMGEWIRELKERDPRRLYAASTARSITPFCDYSATHHVPGVGGVRQKMLPQTNWDYEDLYNQVHIPIIAHEIGQWPVYPVWSEIGKYTGHLKPRNLEQLANLARKNAVDHKDSVYRRASGALSALLYKDEIESFMRTPSCGGFQLLSMQDYIGQGEALIGWLDSFYEPKGNLNPPYARQFLNDVVPLAHLPSYWFRQKDTLLAEVSLFQYAQEDMAGADLIWQILDEYDQPVTAGSFPAKNYSRGKLHPVGSIQWHIPADLSPGKFQLHIRLSGTSYANSWPLWIYPDEILISAGDVLITRDLNEIVLKKLREGASVLFLANEAGHPDYTVRAAWKPLYWSASFFPGQAIETLGKLIESDHPALNQFPSEFYADWNWYRLCQGAKGFDLRDFPVNYQPIVEPISDFHFCKRLGSLFELKSGKGKLIVCGYNLMADATGSPEANQLLYSLLEYMNSKEFQPEFLVEQTVIQKLFSKPGEGAEQPSAVSPQTLPGGNQTGQ